jgi:hypothetical protein
VIAPAGRPPDPGATGPLAIHLSCPKCGAPFVVDDETFGHTCDHCGSLLILEAPDRDEIYVADEQIRGESDLLDTVILYRVEARRSQLIGQSRDAAGNPTVAEAFVEALVGQYEAHLRSVARVLESHRIFVPYWQITGAIVQGILGRRRGGGKLVRLRSFLVEHSVPAYDAARANLRDRGLRLARSRVRPLTVRAVREAGRFLPWRPVADQPYREINRWLGQDLDPGTEPVTKHGEFLHARRVLVYRAYWLGRVLTDEAGGWILLDGGFATLAGYPGEEEVRGLLGQLVADPLGSEQEAYRRVHVAASRCPDCGAEQRIDRRHLVGICANCHRALELTPRGLRVVRYSHGARDEDGGEFLPFWRYRFQVRLAGGVSIGTLEDYARALFPQPVPGYQPKGDRLWVPAFRLLGTEMGDEAFKKLAEWIHASPPATVDEKLPLGGRPVCHGVSLPEPDARALGRFVLLGLHGAPSAARLNTLLLKRALVSAEVSLTDPALVWLPFDRAGQELATASGVRVPDLLVRGGPELEAQRVTVQAARAASGG